MVDVVVGAMTDPSYIRTMKILLIIQDFLITSQLDILPVPAFFNIPVSPTQIKCIQLQGISTNNISQTLSDHIQYVQYYTSSVPPPPSCGQRQKFHIPKDTLLKQTSSAYRYAYGESRFAVRPYKGERK